MAVEITGLTAIYGYGITGINAVKILYRITGEDEKVHFIDTHILQGQRNHITLVVFSAGLVRDDIHHDKVTIPVTGLEPGGVVGRYYGFNLGVLEADLCLDGIL